MERKGVYFEVLFPHFYGGVQYQLPNDKVASDFDKKFFPQREVIAPYLNERLRNYMESFGLNPKPYPYCSLGEKGITLNVSDGGKWIEIWRQGAGYDFIAGHNIEGHWRENAAALNIASDLLEFLSPEFLGPRVNYKDDKWLLKYPLPNGVSQIKHKYFTEEGLRNVYKVAKFGIPKIEKTKGLQRIIDSNDKGEIIIQNGFCEGRGFEGWDIAIASFVISQIMILSNLNFK